MERMSRKTGYWVKVLTIVLALLIVGCDVHIVDGGGHHSNPLYITEIEVTGEYDVLRMEVEVHLVDANTGRLLGCAGQNSGLRHVDYPDIFYEVDAEFVTPDGDLLYYEDIRNRDIEVWVIEDDLDPCPGPYVPHEDDIIGISRPIDGRDFRRLIDLSFDNVVHLRMGS